MVARVLVVDDDPGFRAIAAQLLRLAGQEVVGEAASAEEAIAAAARLTPTGVLLDVHLPDRNGISVAVALASGACPPRVLLVSAEPDTVSPDAVTSCKAVAFIAKTELATADLRSLLDSGQP
jgi:DNA-binding NarL/FixJ family response regulator